MKGCITCKYGVAVRDNKTGITLYYSCNLSNNTQKMQPQEYQKYGCYLWRKREEEKEKFVTYAGNKK